MSRQRKLSLQDLPHQRQAVKAVATAFRDVQFTYGADYANPDFREDIQQVYDNIEAIQTGEVEGLAAIPADKRSRVKGPLGIDVKMETGTGKTYAYTRLMLELNRLYGFNKFLILVPSAPIREGTYSFIKSDYATEHFDMLYDESRIQLEVLAPQKRGRKQRGRSNLPPSLSRFASGSRLFKKRVDALLMTGAMFNSKTMKSETDEMMLDGRTNPYDVLRSTKPVVIIDEPHKFRRTQATYKNLISNVDPLAVIRFGATFPREPKAKKKTQPVIDYNNLVYELNAADSFNEGLVKGVRVQTPQALKQKDARLKLTKLTLRPKMAVFKDESTKKSFELTIGDSLGVVHEDFSGLKIAGIEKDEDSAQTRVRLSNDRSVFPADILSSSVFSESYQEIMLETALENHFAIEWENFNRERRIKTLSLFFIDSVESYRQGERDGHLRLRFHKMLEKHLRANIEKHKGGKSLREREYTSYLEASLADLHATDGGYFSIDNTATDEAVKNEVAEILQDKEALMSLSYSDNSWNTRRFIFSKWTLREGWDSPNVFQIAKLRSSGSEVSKLQEVGRGLRIPVDEYLTRVTDDEFHMTYLIDHSERDFAKKLIEEINTDVATSHNIRSALAGVAEERGTTEKLLFAELLVKDYVDVEYNVNVAKLEEFLAEYPEFDERLRSDKVIDETGSGPTKKTRAQVGVRKHNYDLLQTLWETLNRQYVLLVNETEEHILAEAMDSILDPSPYIKQTRSIQQEEMVQDDLGLFALKTSDDFYTYNVSETMRYGDFLKTFNKITKIPLEVIHAGLIRANARQGLESDFFNPLTLNHMVSRFQEWFFSEFESRYTYKKVRSKTRETALTKPDGSVRESIAKGLVGTKPTSFLEAPENFLFDAMVWDSPLERENTSKAGARNLDEVIVFGKIPRASIRIPTIFGSTTSPDFMYVLKRSDSSMSLNFVVETKDVSDAIDKRGREDQKIKSAQRFFEVLSADKDLDAQVIFREQTRSKDILTLFDEVLSQ